MAFEDFTSLRPGLGWVDIGAVSEVGGIEFQNSGGLWIREGWLNYANFSLACGLFQ